MRGLKKNCTRWRKQTQPHTDGHGDSMINSAQWGRVGENYHSERTERFVQIKNNNACSICKKDFTTITKLCDHFQEKHVDGDKGSDCYQTNYGILFDLEKEKTKEDHDNIEKLLMECKKDMLDDSEDFDEYSDNESKYFVKDFNWQHMLLCKQPSILDGKPDFIVSVHFDK